MKRNPRKYNTHLQKISQTSSPSRDNNSSIESPYFSQRVNPSSMASSYLKFQKIQEERQKESYHKKMHSQNQSSIKSSTKIQTIEDKNERISQLQQKIINKKMQLNMLEQSFQKRTQTKGYNFIDLFCRLTKAILQLSKNDLNEKRNILKMLIKYSQKRVQNDQNSVQIVFAWCLQWIRQLFSLITIRLNRKTNKNEMKN